jgi:general secretion pathway protein H
MPMSAHGNRAFAGLIAGLIAGPVARVPRGLPARTSHTACACAGLAPWRAAVPRGFTLIELLVVLVLVAIGAGIVSLALRDPAATKLEEEGARLTALLESARTESRAAGVPVLWVPAGNLEDRPGLTSTDSGGPAEAFRFVGLPASLNLPGHWLEPRVTAQVVGGKALVLGPDAIVPPQRLVLSLDDRRLEIATDGLAAFAVAAAEAAGPAR